MNDCKFCLENGFLSNEVVIEDDYHFFVWSIDPILVHSGLIISKRHTETPFDYSLEEWTSLKKMLGRAKDLIDKNSPHGYNIGWNSGQVAGQEIKHVHLHIIGRFADEPLAGKGIRSHIKSPSNKRP